jgi:chemotaxis protein CheC
MVDKISKFEKDALDEICSIGAAHASTALSIMIKKRVDVGLSQGKLIDAKEAPDYLDHHNDEFVSILLEITGQLPGEMFILFDHDTAVRLSSILTKTKVKKISRLQTSALKELANIITGSYLSALSDFSHINMVEGIPRLSKGKIGDILYKKFKQYKLKRKVLIIKTKLLIGNKEFTADLVFVLKLSEFKTLFKRICKRFFGGKKK